MTEGVRLHGSRMHDDEASTPLTVLIERGRSKGDAG